MPDQSYLGMDYDWMMRVVRALADGAMTADELMDNHDLTSKQRATIFHLAVYEIQYQARHHNKAQRRAYRLLRRFLSPKQRSDLRTKRYFNVVSSSGRLYRLRPSTGAVYMVEHHRTRDFEKIAYCIHSELKRIPAADETIAHMMLLQTDEDRFLDIAHISYISNRLWNGRWRRDPVERRRLLDEAYPGLEIAV